MSARDVVGMMRHVRGKLRYFLNGREVSRAKYNRVLKAARSAHHIIPKGSGGWPIHSEAMGVHPKSIGRAMALDKAKGAPATDYDSMGRPIWTNAAHKKAFIKAHGYHDKNSYL